MVVNLLDIIIAGLVMGGIYALAAVGLNLQYGVVRVLNMAYGEFIMVGGFIGFWMFTLYRINPILSLFICIPIMYILGWVMHRLIFQPIRSKSENLDAFAGYSILASYGLIFIMQSLVQLHCDWAGSPTKSIFGVNPRFAYRCFTILTGLDGSLESAQHIFVDFPDDISTWRQRCSGSRDCR